MSPTPKMVIETPLAKRKGVIEVGSLADIDTLRAELAEAETMIRAAQAAMAALPVMTDSERDCPSYNPDGSGEHCYRSGVHDEHRDANGDTWTTAEPALCGHPRNADGECSAACDALAPLVVTDEPEPRTQAYCTAVYPVALVPVRCIVRGAHVQHSGPDGILRWTGDGDGAQIVAPEAAVLAESIATGVPLVVTPSCTAVEPGGYLACNAPEGHDGDHESFHRDEVHRWENVTEPDGPAPVTVLINGEPVEVQPCPNVYPETGEPCIGLFDHEPPCRGVEAGEWVPAVTPVTA